MRQLLRVRQLPEGCELLPDIVELRIVREVWVSLQSMGQLLAEDLQDIVELLVVREVWVSLQGVGQLVTEVS